ncbi:MAG: PEP-CTERM system histidine kinase PrsK [Gammaproteobacteria bacterium]|nr:PEP-CTERM system histidine kinase PrsK [Gammaproteobacteria bacterium]
MNLGQYSYLSAALGFGFLAMLLLVNRRSNIQGHLLTLVVIVSVAWAALAVVIAGDTEDTAGFYLSLEILRYVAWFIFLLKLFEPAARQLTGYRILRRWGLLLSTGLATLLLLVELLTLHLAPVEFETRMMPVRFAGHVFLALAGLAIIEQLFRNITQDYRRNLMYLFIGAGGIFAFDFYMYANALLFMGMDPELWEARGFVNLLSVPLLTIAAARNRDWSTNIFVSRDVVLHITAIFGGGLYLLVMAAAGYYLQTYGGSWGGIAQIVFISLAAIFLALVLFSGQLRRQLRVFLGKHFYRNKYDYRHEWLKLTHALNYKVTDTDSFDSSISVLAQIVDARAGLLWLDDGQGKYRNIAAWKTAPIDTAISGEDSIVRLLAEKSYVINLVDVPTHSDEYGQLTLPDWVDTIDGAWLVVPLPGLDALLGFVVLAQPQSMRSVNWEDRDLLKTAARQVASHLAVLMTSDALARARQFEVFNRMSSYMVHDLKNVAAGLEMVARNAETHRNNPEFLEDAFDSVSTAAGDIKRLLDQLRNKRVVAESKVMVDLGDLVTAAAGKLSHRKPVPEPDLPLDACHVVVEKTRLENVLIHLLENAQQATAADGFVKVGLQMNGQFCIVSIQDNGHGMDADFIRDRLFKPFDTTKGNAGIGIGMYESREFVRLLGGDIHVRSEPGAGTQVLVEIPVSCVDKA